jgi:hypothetical protein
VENGSKPREGEVVKKLVKRSTGLVNHDVAVVDLEVKLLCREALYTKLEMLIPARKIDGNNFS